MGSEMCIRDSPHPPGQGQCLVLWPMRKLFYSTLSSPSFSLSIYIPRSQIANSTSFSPQAEVQPYTMSIALPTPQQGNLDRYVVVHVATTCDEHGVYVTKDSAEVIELGWILLDAKNCEEVRRYPNSRLAI